MLSFPSDPCSFPAGRSTNRPARDVLGCPSGRALGILVAISLVMVADPGRAESLAPHPGTPAAFHAERLAEALGEAPDCESPDLDSILGEAVGAMHLDEIPARLDSGDLRTVSRLLGETLFGDGSALSSQGALLRLVRLRAEPRNLPGVMAPAAYGEFLARARREFDQAWAGSLSGRPDRVRTAIERWFGPGPHLEAPRDLVAAAGRELGWPGPFLEEGQGRLPLSAALATLARLTPDPGLPDPVPREAVAAAVVPCWVKRAAMELLSERSRRLLETIENRLASQRFRLRARIVGASRRPRPGLLVSLAGGRLGNATTGANGEAVLETDLLSLGRVAGEEDTVVLQIVENREVVRRRELSLHPWLAASAATGSARGLLDLGDQVMPPEKGRLIVSLPDWDLLQTALGEAQASETGSGPMDSDEEGTDPGWRTPGRLPGQLPGLGQDDSAGILPGEGPTPLPGEGSGEVALPTTTHPVPPPGETGREDPPRPRKLQVEVRVAGLPGRIALDETARTVVEGLDPGLHVVDLQIKDDRGSLVERAFRPARVVPGGETEVRLSVPTGKAGEQPVPRTLDEARTAMRRLADRFVAGELSQSVFRAAIGEIYRKGRSLTGNVQRDRRHARDVARTMREVLDSTAEARRKLGIEAGIEAVGEALSDVQGLLPDPLRVERPRDRLAEILDSGEAAAFAPPGPGDYRSRLHRSESVRRAEATAGEQTGLLELIGGVVADRLGQVRDQLAGLLERFAARYSLARGQEGDLYEDRLFALVEEELRPLEALVALAQELRAARRGEDLEGRIESMRQDEVARRAELLALAARMQAIRTRLDSLRTRVGAGLEAAARDEARLRVVSSWVDAAGDPERRELHSHMVEAGLADPAWPAGLGRLARSLAERRSHERDRERLQQRTAVFDLLVRRRLRELFELSAPEDLLRQMIEMHPADREQRLEVEVTSVYPREAPPPVPGLPPTPDLARRTLEIAGGIVRRHLKDLLAGPSPGLSAPVSPVPTSPGASEAPSPAVTAPQAAPSPLATGAETAGPPPR